MTKAAIYARVSTSEQIKGYSIDSQLEKCREYASSLEHHRGEPLILFLGVQPCVFAV